MEIGKKKINIQEALSIFFSATILIYFFYGFYTNENSAVAGPYDFELIWKNLQLLKQNTFSNLDNALYNDSRPPLAYIIHIYLNPFIQNKEDFRLSVLIISLVVPILFFFCLRKNFKTSNVYLLLFLTSIVMLSPYFRTSAFWGLGENYGLIFLLSAYLIYSKIDTENLKKDSFGNYLLILLLCFFSSLCVYFDQKLVFIPALCLFHLLNANINYRLKYSSIFFFVIMALPFLYLIYLWGSIIPPNATGKRGLGEEFHLFNLGYCLTIISFYVLPLFIFKKDILFEFKKKLLSREFFILIFLLFIYICSVLIFANFETLPNLGKGIVHKVFLILFEDINLRLIFTLISFFLATAIVYSYFNKKIDFAVIIFLLLMSVFTFPFQQEYLDPLIFLLSFSFFRTKLDLNFKKTYLIFFYFATFSISTKMYYATILG